jgi:hypothetical protein
MGAKLAGDHGEHLAYPSLNPNRSSEIKFVNVSDGKLQHISSRLNMIQQLTLVQQLPG